MLAQLDTASAVQLEDSMELNSLLSCGSGGISALRAPQNDNGPEQFTISGRRQQGIWLVPPLINPVTNSSRAESSPGAITSNPMPCAVLCCVTVAALKGTSACGESYPTSRHCALDLLHSGTCQNVSSRYGALRIQLHLSANSDPRQAHV